MSISLRKLCFQLWKPKYERKGIEFDFTPLFTRYIGAESTDDYNDIIQTLNEIAAEHVSTTLCFDREIPLGDASIVTYFSKQLESLDINHITAEDVPLFDDNLSMNKMYADSLNYVVQLALQNENFFNYNIQRNFVKKMIVWSYLYLKNNQIVLTDAVNPVCLYYGEITRHEIYFLILLYRMTFDVIYINPLKEEFWDEIDKDKLSKTHKNSVILPILSMKQRSEKGCVLLEHETATFTLEQNIEDTLFIDGVYKPWQLRGYHTEPVFVKSTLIDLRNNFRQPAKVRPGFSVKNQTVYIPYFFQKIEGEYNDFSKYCELVHYITDSEQVLFLQDDSCLPEKLDRDDTLSLAFCMDGNGTCNLEKVKKMDFYPLKLYKDEIQDLILEKINECITDNNLYKHKFTKEEKLRYIMLILFMDRKIIQMIDNFDFANQVPKFVFFINKGKVITEEMLYFIGFLSKMGFDIVIFDPSGMFNLSTVLSQERANIIRLDTMNYERSYEQIKRKDNFLSNVFDILFK